MMQKRKVSRREFIRLSAVGSAGVVLAACTTSTPTEVAAPTATTAAPMEATQPVINLQATATTGPTPTAVAKFKEAPMLADMVSAGKLPPVEERLPSNPGVLPSVELIGDYGGGVRRAFKGVSDRWGPTKMQDHGFVWFDKSLAVQPRLAELWEVNADATEWVFYLRKGTKWSDGTDFTTGDIKWWYDNELQNTTLNPSVPTNWRSAKGTMMGLEVLDDYTAKFTFDVPTPLFIYANLRGIPVSPGFYMAKYHVDLTPDKDALLAEVKDKGFDSWDQYYVDRNYWYMNPERPSVGAWVSANALSNELFQMTRNPYFFGTDAEGKQLPYIDNVQHRLYQTPDVFNLWIVNGEIDFQARGVSFGDYTLLKESESQGDYKVMLGINASHLAMQPNHSTKNEKLREFFQNQNVRIAMNLAMNRQEMNDLIWNGMLSPRQYSPLKLSPQYSEKAANAYIDYDPDKANELLDGEGYMKGPDGIRTWKDGSGQVTFIVEGTAESGTPDEDTVQLLVKYLNEVGIKATYKSVERSLYTEHYEANDIDAAFWGGDRTVLPIVPQAIIFRGTQPDRPWAAGYAIYSNLGADAPNAEKPPDGYFIWDIWNIWDNEIAVEPDPEKQNAAFQKILDIWAEQVPMVGLLGEMPAPVIVKNGFHNFIEGAPIDDTTGDENVYGTETYYWDNPNSHQLSST